MNLIDDAALLKMAEAEVIENARKAAMRHSIAGITGWQQCPKPNKIFLTNAILQTVSSNRIFLMKGGKSSKKHKNTNRKLIKKDEKINITYKAPKKKEKQLDVNKTKRDSKVKMEQKCLKTLRELKTKTKRERLKS